MIQKFSQSLDDVTKIQQIMRTQPLSISIRGVENNITSLKIDKMEDKKTFKN